MNAGVTACGTAFGYGAGMLPTTPFPIPSLRRAAVSAFMLAGASAAWAQTVPTPEGRPLWEAGVAVIGANSADYPAAGTRRWRGAVAPIIIYRGERLRADGEGVRGRLINTGRFELDLSAAAGFNARSNAAREGMPDLDYTFELGPQAIYRVPLDNGQQVSAHLKARAVVSTDGRHTKGRGMVVEQEFRWQRRGWPDAASQVQAGVQFTWGSEKLHDYFYQVEPSQATAVRPAYDAKAGYFGSALRAGMVRRLSPSLSLSVGTRVDFHGGAANEASPLFQRKANGSVLVALFWTPWRSSAVSAP